MSTSANSPRTEKVRAVGLGGFKPDEAAAFTWEQMRAFVKTEGPSRLLLLLKGFDAADCGTLTNREFKAALADAGLPGASNKVAETVMKAASNTAGAKGSKKALDYAAFVRALTSESHDDSLTGSQPVNSEGYVHQPPTVPPPPPPSPMVPASVRHVPVPPPPPPSPMVLADTRRSSVPPPPPPSPMVAPTKVGKKLDTETSVAVEASARRSSKNEVLSTESFSRVDGPIAPLSVEEQSELQAAAEAEVLAAMAAAATVEESPTLKPASTLSPVLEGQASGTSTESGPEFNLAAGTPEDEEYAKAAEARLAAAADSFTAAATRASVERPGWDKPSLELAEKLAVRAQRLAEYERMSQERPEAGQAELQPLSSTYDNGDGDNGGREPDSGELEAHVEDEATVPNEITSAIEEEEDAHVSPKLEVHADSNVTVSNEQLPTPPTNEASSTHAYLTGAAGPNGGCLHVHAKFLAAAKASAPSKGGVGPNPAAPNLPSGTWSYANGQTPRVQGLLDRAAFRGLVRELAEDLTEIGASHATPQDSALDNAYDTATHTPKALRLGGYMNEAAFIEAATVVLDPSKRNSSTSSSTEASTSSKGHTSSKKFPAGNKNPSNQHEERDLALVSNEVIASSEDEEVDEPPIPALVPAGVPPLVPLPSHTEEANPVIEGSSRSSSGDEDDRERFLPGNITDADDDDDEGYRGDGSKKRSQRIRFILDPRGASVSSLDHSSVERSASIDRAAKRPKGPVWAKFKPKGSNELPTAKTAPAANGLHARPDRSSLDRGSAPDRGHNRFGPAEGLHRNDNIGNHAAANVEKSDYSKQLHGQSEDYALNAGGDSPRRHPGGNFASMKPRNSTSNHQQAPRPHRSPLLGDFLSPPGGGLRSFPRSSTGADPSTVPQQEGAVNRVANKRTPFSFTGPIKAAGSAPKEPLPSSGRVPNRFRGAARTANRFVEGESTSADVLKEAKNVTASEDELEYLDGEEEAEDVEDALSTRNVEPLQAGSHDQRLERLPNESEKEQPVNQADSLVLQRDQSWRESRKPFFTPFQWPTSQLLLSTKDARAEGGPPPRGSVRRLENHILLWEHCGGWDDDSLLTSYTPEEAAAANTAASIAEAKALAHARVMNKIAHAQEPRSGGNCGGRVRSNSRARREARRLKTLRPCAPLLGAKYSKPIVRRAANKPVTQNQPEWASLTLPLPRFQNAPASQVLAAKESNEQKLVIGSGVQDRDVVNNHNDSYRSANDQDLEADTRALARLEAPPPSADSSPQSSRRSTSPARSASSSSHHTLPSSSQGRSHLPQFMAPPHWHVPPRPKPVSPPPALEQTPSSSSSLPLAWRNHARQGLFQIESRMSRRASTDLNVMPMNRSNELVQRPHQLGAPISTPTWDAIREHIAAAREAKETRQLPSFLRRRRNNTAPNVPFLTSHPLRSPSQNDISLGQSFDGGRSTEGTSFESGHSSSIDLGSVVWNSGRKVLLRAPAPSQENVAYEDDSPRPNLEASTGGRNAVDVGQDEDENASATPPRDASGARVATPVRERSDDSISSGQSASSTRTSSWFNKTKAIASLWRKRDEEALNAAVAPPLVKRPIVRVRTLGDRQAPQRMPSAEPRHTAGFESIVNDDDEENDLGRRLQAFLGDRDGDGRNIPRSSEGHDSVRHSSSMNEAVAVSDNATQAARSMRNYSMDVVSSGRSQPESPPLPVETSEHTQASSTKSATPSPPPLSQDLLRSPGRSARIPFAGGSTAERLALTRTNSGLRHTTILSEDDCSESAPPPTPMPSSSSASVSAQSLADLSAWEARNTERLAALRTPQGTMEDVNESAQKE